jgi:hypothetical protein
MELRVRKNRKVQRLSKQVKLENAKTRATRLWLRLLVRSLISTSQRSSATKSAPPAVSSTTFAHPIISRAQNGLLPPTCWVSRKRLSLQYHSMGIFNYKYGRASRFVLPSLQGEQAKQCGMQTWCGMNPAKPVIQESHSRKSYMAATRPCYQLRT